MVLENPKTYVYRDESLNRTIAYMMKTDTKALLLSATEIEENIYVRTADATIVQQGNYLKIVDENNEETSYYLIGEKNSNGNITLLNNQFDDGGEDKGAYTYTVEAEELIQFIIEIRVYDGYSIVRFTNDIGQVMMYFAEYNEQESTISFDGNVCVLDENTKTFVPKE